MVVGPLVTGVLAEQLGYQFSLGVTAGIVAVGLLMSALLGPSKPDPATDAEPELPPR
jgi:hypothetical protein